jgi:TPR repeat protein
MIRLLIILLCFAATSAIFAQEDRAARVEQLRVKAQEGNASAQLQLAEEHLEGEVLPVDEARAVDLTRAAADKNYARAQFELAEMYAFGMGEPRHAGETPVQLYLKAATNGNGEAMVRVARRYRVGFGVERDQLEAIRWLARSIGRTSEGFRELLDAQGEPRPNLKPEDKPFAALLALYMKARRGDASAAFEIGRAFLAGTGGKPNPVTAFFWLSFATRNGQTEATSLAAQAREQLTPEQISNVEKELQTYINNLRAPRTPAPR